MPGSEHCCDEHDPVFSFGNHLDVTVKSNTPKLVRPIVFSRYDLMLLGSRSPPIIRVAKAISDLLRMFNMPISPPALTCDDITNRDSFTRRTHCQLWFSLCGITSLDPTLTCFIPMALPLQQDVPATKSLPSIPAFTSSSRGFALILWLLTSASNRAAEEPLLSVGDGREG